MDDVLREAARILRAQPDLIPAFIEDVLGQAPRSEAATSTQRRWTVEHDGRLYIMGPRTEKSHFFRRNGPAMARWYADYVFHIGHGVLTKNRHGATYDIEEPFNPARSIARSRARARAGSRTPRDRPPSTRR